MGIERLKVKRYEGKAFKSDRFKDKPSHINKYYFGTEIEGIKFNYMINRLNDKKETVLKWKNNFYGGYKLEEKYVLLSTEGISIFDLDWKNRKDMKIDRTLKLSLDLEKLNHRYTSLMYSETELKKHSENMIQLEIILKDLIKSV